MPEVCIDDFSNERNKTLFTDRCKIVKKGYEQYILSLWKETHDWNPRHGDKTLRYVNRHLMSWRQKNYSKLLVAILTDGSSTEMPLERSEDERKSRENNKLLFTNEDRHLTENGNWKWRSKEREGMCRNSLLMVWDENTFGYKPSCLFR